MNVRTWSMVGLAAAVLCATGCESLSGTAKGGLIGGGAGAGLGALAGSASGNAGKGALIGGLAGTVIGGIVGNDVDNEEKKRQDVRLAVAESRPTVIQTGHQGTLGVFDVIQLSKEGMNEDVIINQIRSTQSAYQLSTEDVRALSANGVSPRVIVEMQNRRPAARVIREQPPVIYHRPPPIYVVEPYPRPRPFVGGAVYVR